MIPQLKTGPSAYEVRQHLRLSPYHLSSIPEPGKEVGDAMMSDGGRHGVTTSGLRAIGAPSAGIPAPKIDRSACAAKRHGDEHALKNDKCRCPDAREAYRLYRKRIREGRHQPRLVDSTGTQRRLKALMALGWPSTDLATWLGFSTHRTVWLVLAQVRVRRITAERAAAFYERLQGTPGPSQRTRALAAGKGWAPPHAWEDIDDHAAEPVVTRVNSDTDVDQTTVDWACAGLFRKPNLTLAERELAIERMTAEGRSAPEIAARVGVDERTVVRTRSAMRPKAVAA